MATAFPAPVTAVQVGNFFVGQYYQVLQSTPNLVHQFYTDDSHMTRIDGTVVEDARAMLQIHSLIMSLNFTSIEIKTAQSMESLNGGVMVYVSGSVQSKEFSTRRRFTQTFFLAPQEKGYFVLNDIFQFIDEEQEHQHPTTILAHENYDSGIATQNPLPEPVSDYGLGGIQGGDFVPDVHGEESEAVDKYTIPEPQQPISEADNRVEEEIQVEEPSPSYPSSISAVQDTPPALAEEHHEEPIKHTYASILRISKGHSRAPVPQQAVSRNIDVASEWNDTQQLAPTRSYAVQSAVPQKPSTETAEETFGFEDEGEVTSIYVRNLPSSASASDLEQEFKNFGRIKPDGVLIKSRKDVGVYYAFVEFEDIVGVQNAVKASPILLNGRQIYVEERRPNTGSSRGRRGRRGGYAESSRGRFGARTFGRGNGQESNARDYNGRPRGNGFSQRGPRQDRGILGPQGTRDGQQASDFAS